jgi:hypothetical protein
VETYLSLSLHSPDFTVISGVLAVWAFLLRLGELFALRTLDAIWVEILRQGGRNFVTTSVDSSLLPLVRASGRTVAGARTKDSLMVLLNDGRYDVICFIVYSGATLFVCKGVYAGAGRAPIELEN